jgi:phenylalanyl-tRNA synthetase beta chain
MRLLVSWLRDFVDVTADPAALAESLALRGFEVAGIEALGDDDAVIDFEVTANRPDCLSVLGFAREAATLYDLPLRLPSAAPGAVVALRGIETGDNERLSVAIEDADLCPRYAAAVAEVTTGPSPAWLAARLQAAGVRPIGAVVDVTNYVLLELGHPMHAFDLSRLAPWTASRRAGIVVRRARPGESITTLDGVARALDADMLVIADADRPQAVAGVMGGEASEVSAATTMVAFESAYFKPAAVRWTSRRLGLKTEASARFERGADISAPVFAIERALALLDQIGAGRAIGRVIDRYPSPRGPREIRLRRERLAVLLGITVPDGDVERILRGLGLTVAPADDGWIVTAPTFRVDLLREADVVEEVGRHYGFDKLPATFPVQREPAPAPDPRVPRDRRVRGVLTAAGLSEAVTFAFIEARAAQPFAGPVGVVPVANPLSGKFDTLRPSLLPGLVDAVAHNRRHGRHDVGLFEIGARFTPAGETRGVAAAWTGAPHPHWKDGAREVDVYDVTGLAERLCEVLDLPAPVLEPEAVPYLVPGQTAAVMVDGTTVGVAGQVDPAIVDRRGAPRQDAVFVVEIDLDAARVLAAPPPETTVPLPRFPSVVRDLSIVVADTLPATVIRGTIQATAARDAAPLVSVAFFDRYQGKGVRDGAVSLSLRLTFQAPDRTLTDGEVQGACDGILQALEREHGAEQR